jgi:hypothetical protein
MSQMPKRTDSNLNVLFVSIMAEEARFCSNTTRQSTGKLPTGQKSGAIIASVIEVDGP